MTLRISSKLALPTSFVTQSAAILAQRRKGKTYAASVIAEEMVREKLPFVVLDPTGAWWGLRAAANATDPGLPVLILGGEHGDVPLERTAGKIVAELVIEQPGYYVIDFSSFESGAAEKQFATDFAQRLYRRKGQPGADFPLHLFIDEADRFVPQRIMDRKEGDAAMLGAFETIVRRGGLRGLGTTLISQRAAVVNKNVLEQIDVLMVLRVVGPNDQRAIRDYVVNNGTAEQVKALMDSLASLDIGEAWVWEPGGDPPLFDRVRIRERHTFNSSATPQPGEHRAEPRRLAAVDLDLFKQAMSDTIEKAKADDPKELRRQIVDLQRELKLAHAVSTKVPEPLESIVERIEVPVIPDAQIEAIDEIGTKAQQVAAQFIEAIRTMGVSIDQVLEGQRRLQQPTLRTSQRTETAPKAPKPQVVAPARRDTPVDTSSSMGKAEHRMLSVLADFPEGRTRRQLALQSGYSPNTGHVTNTLSALRSAGRITEGFPVFVTQQGLRGWQGLMSLSWDVPTGRDVYEWWMANGGFSKAEKEFLAVLAEEWPKGLGRSELAQRAGYEPSTGHVTNTLSALRTKGLITKGYPVCIVDELMSA